MSETLSTAPPANLDRLAERCGIELMYWDIFGRQHFASDEVKRAILHSLGVDPSARDDEERVGSSGLLPATVVLSEHAPVLDVTIPAAAVSAVIELQFDFENGERRTLRKSLANAEPVSQDNWRVTLRISLDPLPLGYHNVTATIGSARVESQSRVIVCPSRAYVPERLAGGGRIAGVGVSLYGVRSERNWGCGDFTDLKAIVDWAAQDLNAAFIALNPLHAIPNRTPYNTSPYLPNCSYYRNFIYLDIESVPEFAGSGELSREERIEIEDLRRTKYVEYERVSALKHRVLKAMFDSFWHNEYSRQTPRAAEFRAYVQQQGAMLERFAIHSALDEVLHAEDGNVWNCLSWPEAYRHSESRQTREFAEKHSRLVLFYQYVQWLIDGQLADAQKHARDAGMPIGLYHDLALATDRCGADLWMFPDFYVGGCRVGAPPDNFSPKGQDWSFPPPNSRRHLADGYRLFSESIRKACEHGGALRIDHVMRLFHLYWIPEGMEASEGTYVRERHEDLVRILALESVRNRVVIVGEDLGTVPDYIRDTLKDFGILSYRLFYFEQDQDRRFRTPREYPPQALVSISTHDLPTVAGFWQYADIEARRAAGVLQDESSYRRAIDERNQEKQKILELLHRENLLPEWYSWNASDLPELTGELHNAIVGFVMSTPSMLALINQEDLFKDTEQQNLPGTTAEYPNWRHKMRYRVEELRDRPAADFTAMFRGWVERSGRGN